MDRSIWYSQEQWRSFDITSWEHDLLLALGTAALDLTGSSLATTVVSGLTATAAVSPPLTVSLTAGRIYQFTTADAVAVGSIPQDLSQVYQQGFYAANNITLSTSGITAGQSRWSLIQAQFSQADSVRTGDPNGGIPPFYNASNPSSPLNGQGGLGATSPTVRQGLCILQVLNGTAATTGSEVPPTPSTGWVPLYLVDLTYGQTTITTPNILVAGPSVGTNVPSNYPYAPFLAGLLSSHHSGATGQAPKIKLASETQGTLPYANMSPVRQQITANTTWYVNGSTGNDSTGTGTSGAPWATIQQAVNYIQATYDGNKYIGTISVADGTYAPFIVEGPFIGFSDFYIYGDLATPLNCTINNTAASTNCIQGYRGAFFHIGGFHLTNSGANGIGVIVTQNGCIVIDGAMNYGACANGQLYCGDSGSMIYVTASYTISAGTTYHWYVIGASRMVVGLQGAMTITISSAVSINYFAYVSEVASLAVPSSTVTYVNSGSVTGQKFYTTINGAINTGGAPTGIPGTTGGTTASGGQCV